MAEKKPTVVIIGAGWHTPKSYTKLTSNLRSCGFEVFVPRLLAMNGSRPPNAGLKEDADMVHDYIESICEAGRRVIVLMHSYGGHVGTNGLVGLGIEARTKQNLPGGITYLIYMAAHSMLEGQAMMDNVKTFGQMDLIPFVFEFADDMIITSLNPHGLVIGQEASDEEAAAYEATFASWNGGVLYQPLERCAWREIPTAYIHTTNDMTLPFDYQKHMVDAMKKEGKEVEVFTIVTGHCPNLTETEEVVAIVEKIAVKSM